MSGQNNFFDGWDPYEKYKSGEITWSEFIEIVEAEPSTPLDPEQEKHYAELSKWAENYGRSD